MILRTPGNTDLISDMSLHDRSDFVLSLQVVLSFVPGRNKIKYYFENSNF